jgi:hypothetical protein
LGTALHPARGNSRSYRDIFLCDAVSRWRIKGVHCGGGYGSHDRPTGPGGLRAQCPKPITQHGYPKTAAPRIDPAQDLVDRPNEKSTFENYFESHA